MSNTNDYRSPATTHSSYAKDDPTAQTSTYNKDQPIYSTKDEHHHHHPTTTTNTSTTTTTSNNPNTNTNTTHGHTGGPGVLGSEKLVKTGEYATGLESGSSSGIYSTGGSGFSAASAVPVVGDSYQSRVSGVPNNSNMNYIPGNSMPGSIQPTVSGYNNNNGLVVDNSIGGALGSAVVLGGQCECTRNGGVCEHGDGKCICRGCTTRATTVNPGINVGISTNQYTAPVGTTGIGGGVADPGVGIAGMIHPTNTTGTFVNPTDSNCQCVKNTGTCSCPAGTCSCDNCQAKRRSYQQTSISTGTNSGITSTNTSATTGTGTGHHHHHHHHHVGTERHNVDSGGLNSNVVAGSEYIDSSSNPNSSYHYASSNANITQANDPTSPLTDNSNIKTRV